MPNALSISSWVQRFARWWERIAWVHPSLTDVGDQRRARLLMAFALVLGGMLGIGAFFSIRSSGMKLSNILLCIFSLSALISYALGHTRYYRWGALVLPVGLSVMGYSIVLGGSNTPDSALFSTLPLAMVLGSALLQLRGQFLLLVGNILALIWLSRQSSLPYAPEVALDAGIFVTIGALLMVVTLFRNSLEKARLKEVEKANQELLAIQNTLEVRVEGRTQALEAARCEAEAARQQAEAANRALGDQMWQVAGQAQLNEAMRGDQDMHTLAESVIGFLCRYLDLPVGVLYLRRDRRLHLVGGYAYPLGLPDVFDLGDGLLGQVALDKRVRIVSQPSDGRYKVSSGIGAISPAHVVLVPLVMNENVYGVIELGALVPFSERATQFLERTAESIAVAVHSAQTRAHLNELLEETQRQAEELQAQEEELRAANEELLARTELL